MIIAIAVETVSLKDTVTGMFPVQDCVSYSTAQWLLGYKNYRCLCFDFVSYKGMLSLSLCSIFVTSCSAFLRKAARMRQMSFCLMKCYHRLKSVGSNFRTVQQICTGGQENASDCLA
jgi:hypothetical protein